MFVCKLLRLPLVASYSVSGSEIAKSWKRIWIRIVLIWILRTVFMQSCLCLRSLLVHERKHCTVELTYFRCLQERTVIILSRLANTQQPDRPRQFMQTPSCLTGLGSSCKNPSIWQAQAVHANINPEGKIFFFFTVCTRKMPHFFKNLSLFFPVSVFGF